MTMTAVQTTCSPYDDNGVYVDHPWRLKEEINRMQYAHIYRGDPVCILGKGSGRSGFRSHPA